MLQIKWKNLILIGSTYAVQLTESPVNTIVSVETRNDVTMYIQLFLLMITILDKNTDSVLYVRGNGYRAGLVVQEQ